MGDMLSQGAAWLAQQMRRHAAKTVTYARGDSVADVRATPGSSTFEVDDAEGLRLQYQSSDFVIHVDELVLDGLSITPQPGDRITAGGVVYEVMGQPGQPCWRWVDVHRNAIRVHCKIVEESDE